MSLTLPFSRISELYSRDQIVAMPKVLSGADFERILYSTPLGEPAARIRRLLGLPIGEALTREQRRQARERLHARPGLLSSAERILARQEGLL